MLIFLLEKETKDRCGVVNRDGYLAFIILLSISCMRSVGTLFVTIASGVFFEHTMCSSHHFVVLFHKQPFGLSVHNTTTWCSSHRDVLVARMWHFVSHASSSYVTIAKSLRILHRIRPVVECVARRRIAGCARGFISDYPLPGGILLWPEVKTKPNKSNPKMKPASMRTCDTCARARRDARDSRCKIVTRIPKP